MYRWRRTKQMRREKIKVKMGQEDRKEKNEKKRQRFEIKKQH